jgi:hypothetical protein
MRVRRGLVGLVVALAGLVAVGRADALSCIQLPLEDEAFAADSVVEGTIIARRPVNVVLRTLIEWFQGSLSSLGPDRYELALDNVRLLRGVPTATIRTSYEYLEPGSRHVFIAKRRLFGTLTVSPCIGYAIDATQSARVEALLADGAAPGVR